MPSIDFLFNWFDANKDGCIDKDEWTAIITDDSNILLVKDYYFIYLDLNPLQMIREVIEEYNLTAEDMLHKMKKKILDDDMTFN